MAKLNLQAPAGFNAVRNREPKKIRLDEIVIDPDISKIFDIQVKIKDDVLKSILNRGYDPEQPVVLWKDKMILVDGRTRYTASKEAGLDEIFAYEREFASREDAILYAFERQAIRRNLSSKEIIKAAQMIPGVRRQKGQGRIAEEIAQMLNVSPATVYQARKIVKEAPPEDIEAIKNGEASLNSVYDKLTKKPNLAEKEKIAQPIIEWLLEEIKLQTLYVYSGKGHKVDEKEAGYLYGLKRALSSITNRINPTVHFLSEDESARKE